MGSRSAVLVADHERSATGANARPACALGDRLRATGIRDGGCDYELTGRAVGVRPDTVYGPEAVPGLTVPDELELSPQLIVA